MINFLQIIEKIKEITKLDKDKDLAKLLNATPENFSRWKTRNSIPYEQLIYFSNEHNIDLNWLLSDKGEKYLNNYENKEIQNIIKLLEYAPKKYIDIIKEELENMKNIVDNRRNEAKK